MALLFLDVPSVGELAAATAGTIGPAARYLNQACAGRCPLHLSGVEIAAADAGAIRVVGLVEGQEHSTLGEAQRYAQATVLTAIR